MKLRNKMVVIFGLIFVVFFASISFFSSQKAVNYLDRMSNGAYKEVLKQASVTIDYRMKNYERVINTFYISDEFQELLIGSSSDAYDAYLANKRLRDFVESLLNTYEYVPHVKVYNFSGNTFSNNVYKESDITDLVWKERVLSSTLTGTLWSVRPYDLHGEQLIKLIAAKALRNKLNNEVYGIVSLEIDPGYLFEPIQNVDLFTNGNAYVIDRQGTILFRQSDRLSESFSHALPFIDRLQGESGYFTETIDGEPYLTVYENSGNWTIVGTTPVDGALLMSREVKNYILTLSVFLIGLGIAVLYLTSFLFTNRLSRLTDEMKKVSKGVWDDVQLDMRSNDEIGEMNKVFQLMMRKLNKNIDEISEMKSNEFAFKLKALQAQINPHFLYNTLSTINWMAMGIGADDISQSVNALAKYYRIALSNGKEIITVKEELDHIQAYIYLQQIRIKDHIVFRFEIDETALPFATPKMILQPIVENAIIHGIEKHKKTGVITISVQKADDRIILTVADDGCGMALRGGLAPARADSGYGLYNIDTKIKLFFGNEYGVHIQSEAGAGTKVTVVIPASSGEQGHEASQGADGK